MLACTVLGHRLTFRAEGPEMRWECQRGCGEGGGVKRYATAEEARRYADAFDLSPTANLGERAPLIGLFPLRLWRRRRHSKHR